MKGYCFLLGCIHRSSSSSASNNDNLIDLLNNVGEDKASHKVIIGDFIWRRIQWNDGCGFLPDTCSIDNQEQRFLSCVDDIFLIQHVSFPTRLRGCDQQSLLDLVFTNESNMVGKVEALCPLGANDHISLNITLVLYTESSINRPSFIYFKCDFVSLRSII